MRRSIGNSILVHVNETDDSVMGVAKSLDMAGVIFEFVDAQQSFPDTIRIDILVLNQPKRDLLGVPCKVVCDRLSQERLPFSSLAVRHVELRFKALSEEQQKNLWKLLGWLTLENMRRSVERPMRKRHRRKTNQYPNPTPLQYCI